MSFKQRVLGQNMSYLTTETRNACVVQYPEINITVFKRHYFNKTTEVEKCEDAKGVNRSRDIKISARDAFLE